jgi:hypothetical protein
MHVPGGRRRQGPVHRTDRATGIFTTTAFTRFARSGTLACRGFVIDSCRGVSRATEKSVIAMQTIAHDARGVGQ